MEQTVSRDMHDGRCKIEDERFERDDKRINDLEGNVDKLTTVSVQMGEILKQNNETLKTHEQRIVAIECKPSKLVDTAKNAAIITLVGAFFTAIAALIFK